MMISFLPVLKSLQDGSFPSKVMRRLSGGRLVDAPPVLPDPLDQFMADHYPGEGWRALSRNGRRAWSQFFPLFEAVEIHTIAYVGAHDGTTALALNEAFPGREFILLEPVPQVFQSLVSSTGNHPNMRSVNVAAGKEEARSEMHVDRYLAASSILPYEPLAICEFPFLGEQTTVQVQVKALDSILCDSNIETLDFLVMDVQGYEDKVLQGASRTLKRCKAVMSELSLQPLYVDSSTFDSVYQTLFGQRFHLHYLLNPLEGTSHQILQIDGIFVRDGHASRA